MAVNRGDTDTDTVDVEYLASSIEHMMSQDLFMSSKRCIFKTPIALYRHNENFYIPDAFSIGPFHHSCPNLKPTETIKAKYLLGLISRSRFPNTLLKDFINTINALEREAREYYAGPIEYSREEFVKILVIDGCFIIELFCRNASKQLREENDPIFSMSSVLQVLGHDLILLENQVPWMVLEHLFSMFTAPVSDITLIELAIAFFCDIYAFRRPARSHDHLRDIKHIPDLVKKGMISSIEVDEEKIPQSGWELIPSATRLVEAGIKLRKSRSKNMLDIKFDKGVLAIPPIRIHEATETIFRNLISYEQCYPNSDDRITSYAMLLDNLIDTAKDVEILCENGIICNWLNTEDAARFFNKLYQRSCVVNKYYHGNLCMQVNEYCEKRWPRWRGILVRNYFNTPWAGLSTFAAVILLILTSVQTWYSMKS
jgi:hypothetical protein